MWTNINSPSSGSSFLVSSQSNSTDYQCVIVISSPVTMTVPSTVVTVTNAYCAPYSVNCSQLDTINNFILVGELGTQINDVSTGCAANSYDNRTSQSITLYTSKTYTAQVSTQYPSKEYFSIWIDFDIDFQFDATEMVASGLLNSTFNTPVNITIPSIGSGATIGIRQLRASVAWNASANPCGTASIYGETHDYTVDILPLSSKLDHYQLNEYVLKDCRSVIERNVLESCISSTLHE
jgi:hypothetical protein